VKAESSARAWQQRLKIKLSAIDAPAHGSRLFAIAIGAAHMHLPSEAARHPQCLDLHENNSGTSGRPGQASRGSATETYQTRGCFSAMVRAEPWGRNKGDHARSNNRKDDQSPANQRHNFGACFIASEAVEKVCADHFRGATGVLPMPTTFDEADIALGRQLVEHITGNQYRLGELASTIEKKYVTIL
jgi:hypothetical protein